MGSINKNIARYELTTVYKHPEAKADIVLVHGLNGNPVKTWTAKNGVYWPTDLLPASLKNEHANVLVYGYNADVYSNKKDKSPSDNFVHMHAQSLVTSLTQHRKSEGTERKPIIWVAHSLGGIVMKRALLYSNDVRAHHQEDFRSIFVSTYGIIFLGTPHSGSDLAGWGRVLQYMSDAVIPRRFFETEPILLRTLKKDNETLASINIHFLDVYQRFRIHMVHENHTTDVKGTKVYVVDASSASPQLPGVTYYGIEATHSGMCKFDSEIAPGYRNVSTAIREWVADSPKVIEIRWEVEEDDRRLRASLENYERTRSYQNRMPPAETPHHQAIGRFQRQHAGSGWFQSPLPKKPRPLSIEIEEMDDDKTPVEEVSKASSSNNEITLYENSLAVVPSTPPPPEPVYESPNRSQDLIETPPSRVSSFPKDETQARALVRKGEEPLFIHPEKFRPNSFFIGREDELRGLHEMLMDRKRRSEGTSAVLIQSMPGGGKTHLARQYVFQHKDDYPGGIYWVRAKSRYEMEYWYWRIAKNEALRGLVEQRDMKELRDPKRIVQIVRKWLNAQSGWLMVLDGVQFDTPGLHEFIPDARNTSLIYTSTERAVTGDPRFDNPQVMELGLLTARQAQDLLLLEMDKKPPWNVDDQARALELVQLMGRLPLMIHVAAQHLKATREPLSRYLKSYRNRPKAGGLPAYRAVREQLEHRGANAALNLISLLVFFDQHIPVEMVSLGLSALDKATPIKSCDASHRKTNLNNTLRTLIAFALIERTEGDDISSSSSRSSKTSFDKHADYLDLLRIHSVVQAFFIDTLQEEHQAHFWLERATALWCRSYDDAHKRIEDDPRVGLPDDYRRFSIHGEKLLQNLDRFKKRYPEVLTKARAEVLIRLEKIQGHIDNLSQVLQAKIVTGSSEEPPASIFDRSSSMSETDSAATLRSHDSQNTWDAFMAGDGESPAPIQSPIIFDPASPLGPSEWPGTPYPADPLMPPVPDIQDDDQETVILPSTWNKTPGWKAQSVNAPPDDQFTNSQREYEDWQEVIPHHRVIRRQESRRYHDRAGAWRDKTIGDPRIGISKELALASIATKKPESRSPSRNRVTARSDAEMELNKIRQAIPAPQPDSGPDSSFGKPTRPSYLLGRNSYSQISTQSIPPADLSVTPVPFSSGLAHIISSPKSWTAATVQRLKKNVLPRPSSPVPIPSSSSPPPPGPIFRGSRTASSSPSVPTSPFPPPPNPDLRRWDTAIPPTYDPPSQTDPLSLSLPTIHPPIWIQPRTGGGYTSQPQSDPSSHRHSSPLNPSHNPSPQDFDISRLHARFNSQHNRRPSYTETEPSPRRDTFLDVDTSYARWEAAHHGHYQSSFPPPQPSGAMPGAGENARRRMAGSGSGSRSKSQSPSPRGRAGGFHSPLTRSPNVGGEEMLRSGSGSSGGFRVGGGVVEFPRDRDRGEEFGLGLGFE